MSSLKKLEYLEHNREHTFEAVGLTKEEYIKKNNEFFDKYIPLKVEDPRDWEVSTNTELAEKYIKEMPDDMIFLAVTSYVKEKKEYRATRITALRMAKVFQAMGYDVEKDLIKLATERGIDPNNEMLVEIRKELLEAKEDSSEEENSDDDIEDILKNIIDQT